MRKRWYTILLTISMVIATAGKCVPAAASLLTREAALVRAGAAADGKTAADGEAAEESKIAAEGKTAEANGGAQLAAVGREKSGAADRERGTAPEERENGAESAGGENRTAPDAEANGAVLPTDGSGAVLSEEETGRASGGDGNAGSLAAGGKEEGQAAAAYQAAVEQNFARTLFIGDSRTDGLSEYGDLGEAEVFAASGMSVFNLFQDDAPLKSGGKRKLEQVLSERQFQTIFLMLGINELGYDYSQILNQYRAAVEQIRQIQPSAVLILEANLHVTKAQSTRSAVFNNDRINALNQDIKRIAKETGSGYVDVNPLFDDANGSLTAEYSSDGIHVLAKYYIKWSDWLRSGAKNPD